MTDLEELNLLSGSISEKKKIRKKFGKKLESILKG